MIHDEASVGALWLAFVGMVVGLGQLLNSKEQLTPRLITGRAIASGALGMAAATAIGFIPEIPFAAQLGLAATIASLGTSALEKVVSRITGGG